MSTRQLAGHQSAASTSPGSGSFPGRKPPPALVVVSVLLGGSLLLPVVYLLVRARQAEDQIGELLLRERTFDVVVNTIVLALSVGLTAALIAIPAAWLTIRTDLPFARLLGPICALPLVIPSYIGALTFIIALGPRGYLSRWLESAVGFRGFPSIYGFWGAWLVLSLFTFPYVFLTVSGALKGIDPVHEEAARSLGRSPGQAFVATTLRQLRPAIVSGMLLASLYAVSDFGVVTLMRYDSLTRAIYVQYQASFDRSYAALLALILVAIALMLVVLEGVFRDRAAYYRIGAGVARQRRTLQLGWRKFPSLLFVLSVITMAIVVPLAVLIWWFLRAWRRGDEFSGIGAAALNTVGLGGSAALLAVLAALPVSILATRYSSRIGRFIERLTYLGYGLPGIVIALAFVFLGANYVPVLYQTVPLLLFGYVVRFVPQAAGSERSSLLQVNPRLEDAARGLGRSWSETLRQVTIPLALPGLLAGYGLVFLTVVKELPITLLLRPTGMETLATEVWTTSGSGAYGRAAGPALLLILLSAIPTILIFSRTRDVRASGDGS